MQPTTVRALQATRMMAMRQSSLLRASTTLGQTSSSSMPKFSLKFEAPKMPEDVPTQTHINPFVKHSVSYLPNAQDFKRTATNIAPWALALFTFFSWTFIYKWYNHAKYGRASDVEHKHPTPDVWYKKYTSVFN
ncbi:hypothetical protein CJU90_4086 [Yarrowia sp. C11]|nr:hypothetical protein CKK34_5695 [Yarrowia sp. E02]KAG5367779.1 hypothetical protein CJU90_4086 [Yarrowia sp. C11]